MMRGTVACSRSGAPIAPERENDRSKVALRVCVGIAGCRDGIAPTISGGSERAAPGRRHR